MHHVGLGRSGWAATIAALVWLAALGVPDVAQSARDFPCPQVIGQSPETQSIAPPGTSCPGIAAGTFLGGMGSDWAMDVAMDSRGFTYVTGLTTSPEFPTTPGAFDRHLDGYVNAFVVKIDPLGRLVYSTFLGGSVDDTGMSVAVDASGNAYVTGGTYSNDFPGTKLGRTPSPKNPELFVTKFDPDGRMVYSTILGGGDEDWGWSIAVDEAGHAYVTGYTLSKDFPATSKQYASPASPWNAFVLKLSPDGSGLVYSTLLGGRLGQTAEGIAVDRFGNAYVTGATDSPDFPVTVDGNRLGGEHDAFVLKLNPAGDTVVFSRLIGGSRPEVATALAVDDVGMVYVTGVTRSPDFPTTPGAFSRALRGQGDAFVVKLAATGDISYSTFLGGDELDAYDVDIGWAITVDEGGHAYVSGEAYSRDFPTTKGALDATYNADRDAFLSKLDPQGTSLVYSTFLGGAESDPIQWRGDVATSLALDPTGNVTLVGGTSAPDFPVTEDAINPEHGGDVDAFFVTLDLVPQPNRRPIAWFVIDQSPDRPDRVSVDAYRSADAEDVTALLEVRWDWENDGAWDTDWSTTKAAAHEYSAPGQYTIVLEVRDTEGLVGNTTKGIDVAPAMTSWASAQPTFGVAPLTVSFEGGAAGGIPPYRFAWTFGDGGTSAEEDPVHTYEVPGTYTATLVVTDKFGTWTTHDLKIVVGARLNFNVVDVPKTLVPAFNILGTRLIFFLHEG